MQAEIGFTAVAHEQRQATMALAAVLRLQPDGNLFRLASGRTAQAMFGGVRYIRYDPAPEADFLVGVEEHETDSKQKILVVTGATMRSSFKRHAIKKTEDLWEVPTRLLMPILTVLSERGCVRCNAWPTNYLVGRAPTCVRCL